MNAPCKDCADRHIGCHGDCAAYLAYRAERLRQYDERLHAVEFQHAREDGMYRMMNRNVRPKLRRKDKVD